MTVETRPPAGPAPANEVTEEIRLTRRALRQAEGGRHATSSPGAVSVGLAEGTSAELPRVPRRTPVLRPGRTVYVTSGPPVPEVAAWSPRTLLVLAALCVLTLAAGTALVVRTVTGQRLSAEGSSAAAALAAALESARADVALLTDAIETARPLAANATDLAEAMSPRVADLSDEAVAAVATAAAELEALVAVPVTEPRLPAGLADLSGLPDRYVSADAATRDGLREAVAAQLDRLPALGDQATDQAGALTDAVAAVRAALGTAIQAAASTAEATKGAAPEAYADSRAHFEATVAALVALGDAPEPDAAARQAFDAYFLSADVLRRSHDDAVQARELAERAAAEEAGGGRRRGCRRRAGGGRALGEGARLVVVGPEGLSPGCARPGGRDPQARRAGAPIPERGPVDEAPECQCGSAKPWSAR